MTSELSSDPPESADDSPCTSHISMSQLQQMVEQPEQQRRARLHPARCLLLAYSRGLVPDLGSTPVYSV
ncbi:hypothetical protein EYF80_046443 [Liparis tanakae]|uniref:Uncharacterized protein n=1 Tax=Liparis tanakae TaxID=230148 RepID=A0A4Z2FR15_9TELE|nr:hypothetical protein EYF80_046443 [Liparis tanakae]